MTFVERGLQLNAYLLSSFIKTIFGLLFLGMTCKMQLELRFCYRILIVTKKKNMYTVAIYTASDLDNRQRTM